MAALLCMVLAGCGGATPTPTARYEGLRAIDLVKQYLVDHPCAPGVGYLWSASYSDGVWQVVRQKDAPTARWNMRESTGAVEPLQATC